MKARRDVPHAVDDPFDTRSDIGLKKAICKSVERPGIPLFNRQDTATASVYRMCEFLCANESNQLMMEMQYFWDHTRPDIWTLNGLPDPQDNDIEQYAILASLVESLVLALQPGAKTWATKGAKRWEFYMAILWSITACDLVLRLVIRDLFDDIESSYTNWL